MPSPFPGMDPYLEDSEIWRGFHHSLADEIKAQLNPFVGPKYFAEVEVRTIIEDVAVATTQTVIPDAAVLERQPSLTGGRIAAVAIPAAPVQRTVVISDEIKLRSVQIRTTDNSQLVTSIEILSPFIKRSSKGISDYRQKRTEILHSPVHLIELDLLRGGERPGLEVGEPPLDCDYVLLVNRARLGQLRPSEIWPLALNETIPPIPVPLLPPDADVRFDLNAALKSVYTRAGYDWRLDYSRPVPPPDLRPEMKIWLAEALPNVAKP